MKEVTVVTRALNPELFAMSGSLIDPTVDRVGLRGTEADSYFYQLMQLDTEWAVNMDEDAFIWDFNRIRNLIAHMKQEGFACCGMPDGGVIADRFHNPVVPNAFFNIIHVAKLKEKFDQVSARACHWEPELSMHTPHSMLKTGRVTYDEFEPYYPYFFWILKSGFKMLYLDAVQWARDPIATILLDHMRQPLTLHCWYTRDYENQKPRFQHAFNFCRDLKAKADQKKLQPA